MQCTYSSRAWAFSLLECSISRLLCQNIASRNHDQHALHVHQLHAHTCSCWLTVRYIRVMHKQYLKHGRDSAHGLNMIRSLQSMHACIAALWPTNPVANATCMHCLCAWAKHETRSMLIKPLITSFYTIYMPCMPTIPYLPLCNRCAAALLYVIIVNTHGSFHCKQGMLLVNMSSSLHCKQGSL